MFVTPPPPPPSGAPDPQPRPHAVPLNRSEERSLAGLEHELRRSDPDLETEMSVLTTATECGPGAGRGGADRVLQVIALGVIVLVLVPREWLAAVLSFGLLLGVPFAMAMIAIRARRDDAAGGSDAGDPGRTDSGPETDEPGGGLRNP